jgi:dipeptidyl aminopeptidase/acylaminoacyl peptidase
MAEIIAFPTRGLDNTVPAQRTPITPGMLSTIRMPSEAQISSDGKRAVFVVWEYVGEEQKQRGRIWTVSTEVAEHEVGEPRPLTKGSKSDYCPRWSPDGKRLAYLSVSDSERAKPQLHIIAAEGGEPEQLCTMPNGVVSLEWSPNGSRIAFLSQEGERPRPDPIVVAPERHYRLWTIYPDDDLPQPVTPAELTVWEYAWSPDSRQLAVYYSVMSGESGWYVGQIGYVAAQGGAVHQLTALTRQASSLSWSPDGTKLAYVSGEWSDRGLDAGDMFLLPLDGSEPYNLTPGIQCSITWCRWFPDGQRLLFAAYKRVTQQIGILHTSNGAVRVLDSDFVMRWPVLSATPDLHGFVALHCTQQDFYDVWHGTVDDGAEGITWHRLSRLNPIADETFALAKTKRIRYPSTDDWEIDALFTHPSVPKTDGRPPLVVSVHGGPSWAWSDDIGMLWTQLLASAGYAVLRPNVRGSWGRGVAFADAVVGDMGGKDFQDVLHGIDYLVQHNLVDGNRVAIAGWSYGGFMTAWAISQTTRFRAAVVGAGVSDWHNFHAQSHLSEWDRRFLGADMLDHPEVYRERSPITYARNITTPTLILHGERDFDVPVSQGYALYRALYEHGIPVEFVIYPREGHGIRERDHQRDLEERLLRWLEKYL